jgi:hypothetical protein
MIELVDTETEQKLTARELLKAFRLPGGPIGYGLLKFLVRKNLLHPQDGHYDRAEMEQIVAKYIIRVGHKRVV